MEDKTSWFVRFWDDARPDCDGIGECGPLPGLSPDATPEFEHVLSKVVKNISLQKFSLANGSIAPNVLRFRDLVPAHYPSITFGIETAWLDLMHGGKRIIFQNDFLKGTSIPINGLIWMGDSDFMMTQIKEKLAQGYRCLKLKVGSLDFEQECDIIRWIRKQHPPEDITVRLDANGAFHPDDAMVKLQRLSEYHIHSIEQPIKAGQREMEYLCRHSPIPVALDEELIDCEGAGDKEQLLSSVKPAFIILKPTLHGGFSGCHEWIGLAEKHGIGWWVTSALESNIGLNAICQFTANYRNNLPQGLGTGAIYRNNIDSPLKVSNGYIHLDSTKTWDTPFFSC